MNFKNSHHRQQGYSMTELMVSMSLTAITVTVFAKMWIEHDNYSHYQNAIFLLSEYNERVLGHVVRDWKFITGGEFTCSSIEDPCEESILKQWSRDGSNFQFTATYSNTCIKNTKLKDKKFEVETISEDTFTTNRCFAQTACRDGDFAIATIEDQFIAMPVVTETNGMPAMYASLSKVPPEAGKMHLGTGLCFYVNIVARQLTVIAETGYITSTGKTKTLRKNALFQLDDRFTLSP